MFALTDTDLYVLSRKRFDTVAEAHGKLANDLFEGLARGLLEYETLSGDEIHKLLDGQPPVRDSNEPTTPSRGSPVPSAGRTRPPRETDGRLAPQPQG